MNTNNEKEYQKTATWRAWQDSALSNISWDGAHYKYEHRIPLLALLLAASSPTNLEKLAERELMPELCRPSYLLRQALKRVWQVMKEHNEQWVIFDALNDSSDFDTGLAETYWQMACQDKPRLAFLSQKSIEPLELPICGQNEICFASMVRWDGRGCYRAHFKDANNKSNLVEVHFFYAGLDEIIATLAFPVEMFDEKNARHFSDVMPADFSVIEPTNGSNPWFQGGSKTHCPRPCYRIPISPTETAEFLELGLFKRKVPCIPLTMEENVRPKDGFSRFMQNKLVEELHIPLIDELELGTYPTDQYEYFGIARSR